MVLVPETDRATLVGAYKDDWHEAFVQVIAGSVRVSNRRETLETSGPAYTQQGISINPSDGLVRLPWKGEFWIIAGSANTYVEVTVL